MTKINKLTYKLAIKSMQKIIIVFGFLYVISMLVVKNKYMFFEKKYVLNTKERLDKIDKPIHMQKTENMGKSRIERTQPGNQVNKYTIQNH